MEKEIQEIIENEYAKVENSIKMLFATFTQQRQSTAKAYSKIVVVEYTEANKIELRDTSLIYDEIILLADSGNSETIYVGGNNPLYPLAASNSVTLKKKNLYDIYFKGAIGDKLTILC